MADLAAFLTARLAEDQELAEKAQNEPFPDKGFERGTHIVYGLQSTGLGLDYQGFALAWDPARVLAEIAAKRRVLARHQRMGSVYCDALVPDACEGCGLDEGEWNVADINECPELLDLAAPFSGHEDFDESWRT